MTSSDAASSAAATPAAAWPAIGLEIDRGLPDLIGHFRREYGDPVPGSGADPRLLLKPLARARARRASDISAAPDEIRKAPDELGPVRSSRYKTTRWRVRLGRTADESLTCALQVQGIFGRSLVQSTLVEPLLSVVLARRREALISASGIVVDGKVLAIAGVSRSGKSTLAVRAWGAGRRLLADDRLIVTGDGRARGFRRRLRLYPDLAKTAPAAVDRLGSAIRRRLTIAGFVRRLTRSWVGLPVLVDPAAVGADGRETLQLGRLVVVDRRDDPAASGVRVENDLGAVWDLIERIVRRDLAWVAGQGSDWSQVAEGAASSQLEILRQAVDVAGAQVAVVSVPSSWPAARAIRDVARALELEP